jgi:hypothetical protein
MKINLNEKWHIRYANKINYENLNNTLNYANIILAESSILSQNKIEKWRILRIKKNVKDILIKKMKPINVNTLTIQT